MVAWSLFLLNLQGQASGRQLLAAHHPHGLSQPTASHIQTYRQSPLPFLQMGLLQGDAYWFSLFSVPDHSESHPMLLVPDLAYLLSGRAQEQSLLHIGSMAPFSTLQQLSGTLLSSPIIDKNTLSRMEINPESCYQKTLKKLLQ